MRAGGIFRLVSAAAKISRNFLRQAAVPGLVIGAESKRRCAGATVETGRFDVTVVI